MATKLVNMKLDPKAREEKYTETIAADRPAYPWGLSITLDDDALEKLGIDTLPEVDTDMMLIAKVTITSVSANASSGGKENRSVGLQITDLCLEKPSGKNATAALYGDEGGKS